MEGEPSGFCFARQSEAGFGVIKALLVREQVSVGISDWRGVNEGWLGGVRDRSRGRDPWTFTDFEVIEGTLIVRESSLFAGRRPRSVLARATVRKVLHLSGVVRG